MTIFYAALTSFLLLNITLGLIRLIRGPSPADRLMSAQLFGTAGIAILLLFAEMMSEPGLMDVALVFALLAVLVVVCFARMPSEIIKPDRNDAD